MNFEQKNSNSGFKLLLQGEQERQPGQHLQKQNQHH